MCRFEVGPSGFAGGRTALVGLVVGCHISDAGMETDPVPSRPGGVDLSAQDRDVDDLFEMGVPGF